MATRVSPILEGIIESKSYYCKMRYQPMGSQEKEQAITVSEERDNRKLTLALDAIKGGFYEHSVPLDETTYHSESWAATLGYRLDEIPSYEVFLNWLYEQVHPHDREYLDRAYNDFIEGRAASYDVEIRIRHKGGHWIWVRGVSNVLERAPDGRVRRLIGIMYDITERKRAEQALRDSEAKMMSIFRAAPIGIGVVSNRVIQEVNGRFCELTGYSRDELIGKSARMVYPADDDYEYVGKEKYRQIEKYGTGTVETRFQRKDGKIIAVLLSSTLIDPNDRSLGVTFTALDITERKRAERILEQYRHQLEQEVAERTAEITVQNEELQKLNVIIRQLSQKTIEAMESDRRALSKEIHDSVAGTLSAIKMQLEAYLMPLSQDSPRSVMPLEEIVTYLIQAIGETRRISRQLRSTILDDFGLEAALVEHIQQFEQFYRGIKVVSQIEIGGEDIPADIQTVLYRVVQEALNNAGKHSAATMARVKLTRNQNQIGLEVADNGCGFDLQTVLPGMQSLMGYGIHSMRERVELCGGKFQIRSEPGKGTVIDVSIPI